MLCTLTWIHVSTQYTHIHRNRGIRRPRKPFTADRERHRDIDHQRPLPSSASSLGSPNESVDAKTARFGGGLAAKGSKSSAVSMAGMLSGTIQMRQTGMRFVVAHTMIRDVKFVKFVAEIPYTCQERKQRSLRTKGRCKTMHRKRKAMQANETVKSPIESGRVSMNCCVDRAKTKPPINQTVYTRQVRWMKRALPDTKERKQERSSHTFRTTLDLCLRR